MANNAITRAILARRPKAEAVATPQAPAPISEQEKQIQSQVSGILSPYEQQQKSALAQRFSGLEQRLFEQELGRGQREADILQRRFAALGGQAGKPTEERAMTLAGREAGRRLDIGQREIEQEKLAQEEALNQLMAEKRLGIGERLRGQQYQTAERQAQQEFQAAQAQADRAAAAEQARLQRELDVKLADMDRALKERQINISEKEFELNTKISLENLAQVHGGTLPEDLLRDLENYGIDTTWYRTRIFDSKEKAIAEAKAREEAKAAEEQARIYKPTAAGTFNVDTKAAPPALSEAQIKALKKPKPFAHLQPGMLGIYI